MKCILNTLQVSDKIHEVFASDLELFFRQNRDLYFPYYKLDNFYSFERDVFDRIIKHLGEFIEYFSKKYRLETSDIEVLSLRQEEEKVFATIQIKRIIKDYDIPTTLQ
jgi:hypothetical protein